LTELIKCKKAKKLTWNGSVIECPNCGADLEDPYVDYHPSALFQCLNCRLVFNASHVVLTSDEAEEALPGMQFDY